MTARMVGFEWSEKSRTPMTRLCSLEFFEALLTKDKTIYFPNPFLAFSMSKGGIQLELEPNG